MTSFELIFIQRVTYLEIIGNRDLTFYRFGTTWAGEYCILSDPYKLHLRVFLKSKLYLNTPADAYLWRAAVVLMGELHDRWVSEGLTFGQRTVAFKNNILLSTIFNQLQRLLEGMKLHLRVNQTQIIQLHDGHLVQNRVRLNDSALISLTVFFFLITFHH